MDYCHGGALCTYVDIATTCSLYGFDSKSRTHVSNKLDVEFLSPAKCGESFLLDTYIHKIGKNIAFTECKMYSEKTLALICSGTHVKSFVDNKYIF